MILPSPLTLPQVFPLLQRHYLEVLAGDTQGWSLAAPNAHYTFSTDGQEVFKIQGLWRGTADSDRCFHRLRELIAACNQTNAFPKAYLWPHRKRGRYGLAAEGTLLITHQPTEAQFYHFMDTVLSATAQLFQDAEQELPELVTWSSQT